MLAQEQQFELLIEGILENGYSVCDNFLTPEEVNNLLSTFEIRYEEGKFKEAGIGKLNVAKKNTQIRGDEILWLESNSTDKAERVLLDKNQAFINHLNRTCFLGIVDTEIHFAKYSVGKFYRRHRDTFQAQKGRVLSVIYYLNVDWVPKNGGDLIIYSHKNGIENAITIAPIAGRMVCFESEKLEHEVAETFANRFSVTGWLKNI
jgi:SM-20-related protein